MAEPEPIAQSGALLEQDVHTLVIACSDGRFRRPLWDLLQNELGVPSYDQLFVPGGAGCLTSRLALRHEEALVEQITLLIRTHAIDRVLLFSHQDCGFYNSHVRMGPEVIEQRQLADLESAASWVRGRRIRGLGHNLEVQAYYVRFEGRGVFLERACS